MARRGAVLTIGLILAATPISLLAQVSGTGVTSAPARSYVVRPVGVGSNISVRARSTRQIQVRVTDENDQPVPDLPILFALVGSGGGNIGSLSAVGGASTGGAAGSGSAAVNTVSNLTAMTNAEGLARVEFVAGSSPGNGTLSATVEGTDFSWSAEIKVKKASFWTTRNTLLVLGGIAAGTAIGVAASRSGGSSRGGQQQPPRDTKPPSSPNGGRR